MYLKFITKRFLDIIPFTYRYVYRTTKIYKNLKLSIFLLKIYVWYKQQNISKNKKITQHNITTWKEKKLFMSLGFVFLKKQKKMNTQIVHQRKRVREK